MSLITIVCALIIRVVPSYRDNDYQKYDGRGILHGTPGINHMRRMLYYDTLRHFIVDGFRIADGFNKSSNLCHAVDKH